MGYDPVPEPGFVANWLRRQRAAQWLHLALTLSIITSDWSLERLSAMDQKNLLVAIVLSLAILLGFEYFIGGPQRAQLAEEARQQEAAQQIDTAPSVGDAPSVPGGSPAEQNPLDQAVQGQGAGLDTEAALAQAPRVEIDTPTISGSLSLIGGRVDDIVLKNYRETIDDDSPLIRLLRPDPGMRPYYADFGWTSNTQNVALPQADSEWRLVEGEALRPGSSVTIEWDNGEGVIFRRHFEVDEHYLFGDAGGPERQWPGAQPGALWTDLT